MAAQARRPPTLAPKLEEAQAALDSQQNSAEQKEEEEERPRFDPTTSNDDVDAVLLLFDSLSNPLTLSNCRSILSF